MSRKSLLLSSLAFVVILCPGPLGAERTSQPVSDPRPGTVTSIYDGDTIKVRLDTGGDVRVRLIGVDSPEYDDPRESARLSAFLARRFAYSRLLQRPVRLTRDREKTDAYGRLLAYVWTDERTTFNETLVREGFASAYLKYPFDQAFRKRLEEAEAEARRSEKGMWRRTPWPVIGAAEAGRRSGEVVTVRFRCVRAFNRSRYRILVPAEGQFEAVIPLDVLASLPGALDFENHELDVTGLVEEFKGRPQVMIGLPAQIKVAASRLPDDPALPAGRHFRLTVVASWIIKTFRLPQRINASRSRAYV
jgi:micrococcal nuclease